jgi:cyclophilin family peptidyl-prolyl cis-trans isomerase/FKBP-type peptidyl-prolyl cis-trans isomerase
MMRSHVAALAVAAALVLAACGGDDDAASVDEPTDSTVTGSTVTGSTVTEAFDDGSATTVAEAAATGEIPEGKPEVELPEEIPTELIVTDLVEGTGDVVEAGDSITVNYVGVLSEDGTEFDNSYDRGEPFTLTIGVGQVIPGWDEGLLGMKEGGRRQLDIPADLAYGDTGAGDLIPPGAALTFVVDVLAPPPPPTLDSEIDTANCPAPDGSSEQQQEFDAYPPTCIDTASTYTAEIVTNKGTVVVELDDEAAPLTVNNFVTLARYHYFDGISCHRIIPGFMAQCGDPTGTGSGGPGYEFPDELPASSDVYTAGTLAMANAGPDTNGSQFFIITGDATFLPPSYSVFGTVVEGLDDTLPALDAAGNPEDNGVPPLEPVTIESVTITEN